MGNLGTSRPDVKGETEVEDPWESAEKYLSLKNQQDIDGISLGKDAKIFRKILWN